MQRVNEKSFLCGCSRRKSDWFRVCIVTRVDLYFSMSCETLPSNSKSKLSVAKSMKFEDVAQQIDPEIYRRFKEAVELGKWPDGRVLTKEQKEICLQTIMMYEAKHQMPDDERIGYVDSSKKTSPCGTDSSSDKGGPDNDGSEPLKILH